LRFATVLRRQRAFEQRRIPQRRTAPWRRRNRVMPVNPDDFR
jgi:hypothetical protein